MTQAAAAGAKPLEGDSAFDAVAADYDLTFGLSPAGRLFRFRLAERIQAHVRPGAHLLDIGSGTGEDAVWLSGQGFRVTAIDPSPAMVEIASRKARSMRGGPAFQRSGLLDFSSSEAFDVAYSNFGALNCIEPGLIGPELSRFLSPGGKAFLVLMGSRPLPLLLREGPSSWSRRARTRVPMGGSSVDVFYSSPGAFLRALGREFKVDRTETLGFLTPPPSAAGWPRRNPILFGLLAAFERTVARSLLLAGFSDHFLIELTRR